MTEMEMLIEKSLDDFEQELNAYNRKVRGAETLRNYIVDADNEIHTLEEMLKYIPQHIESLKKSKKLWIEMIEDADRELPKILSSWNGTFIKDMDNEKLSECPSFSAKPHRKAQMPCSNHTYKDMRFLGDAEDRKCMKNMKQSKIKKQFTDCDVKMFFKAKEEYEDAIL